MTFYDLHGLRIRSQVPLHEPPVAPGPPDLAVSWGPRRAVPANPPPGRVIAEYALDGQRWYTAAQDEDGYTLRFHGTCDFVFSPCVTALQCRVDPGADPEVIPVLLAGTGLAFALGLRGHCVLHASAVELPGGAVAFVGHSGMGKSTAAALLCTAGGRLVADDVLRVEANGRPTCLRGTSALRLRPAATSVVGNFSTPPATRRTADGRLAVAPVTGGAARLPLAAVVVPQPSRDATEVTLTPVAPADAVFTMARFPRIFGWCAEDHLRRQFATLTRLAAAVPVFTAEIPWGPPFSPHAAEQLAALLSAAQ